MTNINVEIEVLEKRVGKREREGGKNPILYLNDVLRTIRVLKFSFNYLVCVLLCHLKLNNWDQCFSQYSLNSN